MKRLLITILFVGIGIVANAQNVDNFISALRDENRVNVRLTFANARIHGMTEAEFAKYEKDWYKDMPVIIGGFVNDLNYEIDGWLRFGNYPEAKYTLEVSVVEVATDGSIDSDVNLINNSDGNVVAKYSCLRAGSVPWGTKLYLIKASVSGSGEKFGEILYHALKKSRSKRATKHSNTK